MKIINLFFILLFLQVAKAQPVTTFAGSGNLSSNNGPVASASFKDPYGMVVAPNGDIYIADTNNHKIRKISDGMVTDFAGSNGFGSTDGIGSISRFYHPWDLAIDSQGNLIVADHSNHKIRKITPDGIVSTVAGTGVAGNLDGNVSVASFHFPRGVTVDANDNIYIADSFNHKIRKITTSGIVSTFAGNGFEGTADGIANTAQFKVPSKIAFDASGNLFVADYGNHKIRKITPLAEVTTFAGSGLQGNSDGIGTAAHFFLPAGICVDQSANVYVADAGNNRIRKITPAAEVTTFAGTNGGFLNGDASIAKFLMPTEVCLDAAENILIADTSNQRIRKIGDSSLFVENFKNNVFTIYPNPFTNSVSVKGENIINSTLQIIDLNGRIILENKLYELENKIDTSIIKSGLYIFKINSAHKKMLKTE